METQFWKTLWDDNQIGFHQDSTNPMLLSHWHKTSLKSGDRVLVPLCGKSLDMLFLKSLGLEVVGVELVEKACVEFFSDNNLAYSTHTIENGQRFDSDGITVFNMDILNANPENVGTFDGLYDRAAVIALPTEIRSSYAAVVKQLLSETSSGLINTIEYPQELRDGPPFSVPEASLRDLMNPFKLKQLESRNSDDVTRLEAWGVPYLRQHTFLLERTQ